jgi:hypothetical protein
MSFPINPNRRYAMQTQLQSTLNDIEVIELEVEEIEIKSIDDDRKQPEKHIVQQANSRQYCNLPARQMVA